MGNAPPPPEQLTIPHRLLEAERRWPERVALAWEGGRLTYAELARGARRAAGWLQRRGTRRGGRVAYPAPARPQTVLLWLGAAWVGAVSVPLDPQLTPRERDEILAHARPDLEVEVEGAEAPGPPHGPDVSQADEADGPGPPQARPEEPAVLIYTSGTTGRPKGVLQSQRTYALTGEAFPRWLGLQTRDRLLCTLPLFHINAQAYSLMGALSHGLPLYLAPRFSVSRFWEWVVAFGASQVNLIGAMLVLLLEGTWPPEGHPLRTVYTAPALDERRHRAVEEGWGVRVVAGYGLSECTFGTIVPAGESRPKTIGRPRALSAWGFHNELEIVDPAGRAVGEGETGEIRLRNAAVLLGYHADPGRTRRALRGGWLHTGDLAYRDREGYLYFAGRADEMIRRRGENVSPAEVEAVLRAHPSVREAAVIGVPSELTEEEVKAYVEPEPGAALEVEALLGWCQGRLAPAKVPRYLEIVSRLPRTATQRVAKSRLRGAEAPRGRLSDRGAGG